MASPLTITLGDEFQGPFTSLVAAAQAAREIRFELLGKDIDCRFVIGSIDLRTPVNSRRAWNMMGPGFADARERLGKSALRAVTASPSRSTSFSKPCWKQAAQA
ncbi:hypothetical protein ACFSLT_04795 [Novosphingobium resinovorum]